MKTNIKGDFQICISVPLIKKIIDFFFLFIISSFSIIISFLFGHRFIDCKWYPYSYLNKGKILK